MECAYCESEIFDTADSRRIGGRELHRECADRFAREWDEAFGVYDETLAECEAAHVFEELTSALTGVS